jgi:hypothetical protein
MATITDVLGNLNNAFRLGSLGASNLFLRLFNSFTGTLSWNPSASRTLILPDKSGTLVSDKNSWRSPTNVLLYSDFINGVVTDWQSDYDGAGNGGPVLQSAIESSGNHPGIMRFQTGTTSTGLSLLCPLNTYYINPYDLFVIPLGQGIHVLTVCVRHETLSTTGELFETNFGMFSSVKPSILHAVFFSWTNAGFLCKCRANSVETSVTASTSPVVNTWYILKIIIGIGVVTFYVNGVVVATITTNIPGANQGIAPLYYTQKTSGATNRYSSLDFIKYQYFAPDI